jgi:hypothetical protein
MSFLCGRREGSTRRYRSFLNSGVAAFRPHLVTLFTFTPLPTTKLFRHHSVHHMSGFTVCIHSAPWFAATANTLHSPLVGDTNHNYQLLFRLCSNRIKISHRTTPFSQSTSRSLRPKLPATPSLVATTPPPEIYNKTTYVLVLIFSFVLVIVTLLCRFQIYWAHY